jgi:ligand-binding sensor domain-containing protein
MYGIEVGKAQTPYLQPIQYPYQIPTKTIYDMFSDKQGLLYLGTDKGLLRFNGKFATPVAFADAYQSDITHIKQDEKGRIWGMNFARQIFYTEKDTLRNFPFILPSEAGKLINFEFTDKYIWVLTTQTLSSYDKKTFQKNFTYQTQGYLSNMKSFDNQIFVVTERKILVFKEDHTHTIQNTLTGFDISLGNIQNKLYGIYQRDSERISIQWQGNRFVKMPDMRLPKETYIHHQTVAEHKMWLCTRQGGYLLDNATGKTNLVFPVQNVTDVVQDYQGNYWISSLHEGLWFCPSLQNISYALPTLLHAQFELSSIYKFGEMLYCGTTDGHILKAQARFNSVPKWQVVGKASPSEIRKIAYNPKNEQIIAGLNLLDAKGKLQNIRLLMKDACFYTYQDQELLLLAASNGMRLLNLSQKALPTLQGLTLDTLSLKIIGFPAYYNTYIQRCYSTSIDIPNKRYWVGYDNGLLMYDFEGKATELQTAEKKHIIASYLGVDRQARLWIGTFQQGLFMWEKGRITAHFQAGKNLKSNHIRKMVVTEDKVWIGTDVEIGYIDLKTLQYTDFLAQSGLSSSFAYKDFFPDKQGIWVILSNDLIYVPNLPTQQKEELRLLPPVLLGNHKFKLETIHYKNSSKVQIHYRLKGLETDWHVLEETQAILSYNNLRKGNYTLEFFAQDAVTKLKSKVQTLHFQVPAKWWETWLFLVGMIILGVVIVGVIAYFIIERNRKKLIFKEQLWVSQIKALQSQMNPHFLYNIMNTVQGLVYSDRRSEASELLGNFSDLMRQTLQISEKPYITLAEEIELLKLYMDLEKVRFDDELEYTIQADFPIDSWEHLVPSMLIQPFVENAFKHGLLHKTGEKRLKVLFTKQEKHLQITIEDNGIGRTHAQEIRKRQARKSTGFAMNATQQRIDLLNKIHQHTINFQIIDLHNAQQEPTGTKIIMNLYY